MEQYARLRNRAAANRLAAPRTLARGHHDLQPCPRSVDTTVRFLITLLPASTLCRRGLAWTLSMLAGLGFTLSVEAALFTAGEAVDLGSTANASGNFLYFFPANVSTSGQLQKLGIIVRSVASPYQAVLGIYADDGVGGGPGTRLASTEPFTISVPGIHEILTTNRPVLPPGNYWISANYQATTTQAFAPMIGTYYYKAQTYNGTLPATVSGTTKTTGQRWNHYAILESDFNSVNIAVEQPAGTSLAVGGSRSLATVAGGSANLTFTITNSGLGTLELAAITISGDHAGDFVAGAPKTNSLAGRTATSFTVKFTPSNSGVRTAVLRIPNSDPNANPFEINLSGQTVSSEQDTDGDGLNDAAEVLLVALGFDWQVNQSNLVSTLYNNASAAGLYTASQVQALRATTPLLDRNPTNGLFTLTIAVQKTTNLTNFTPFPMAMEQIRVTPFGELQFDFSSPDNTSFFRLMSY